MSPDKRAAKRAWRAEDETPDPKADAVVDRLKGLYDEIAREPLPDQLLELLDKLEKAERRR